LTEGKQLAISSWKDSLFRCRLVSTFGRCYLSSSLTLIFLCWGCALTDSVGEFIRTNLGERTLRKIEDRLNERYKMSLDECLSEFEKLDTILREFFGEGAEGIEQKFFKSMHKPSE